MNMNATFDNAANGEPIQTLPANGQGKIILCDVNGTLLLVGENNVPTINTPLVDFLLAAEKRGYQVQLHSMAEQSLLQFKLLGRKAPSWAEYMGSRDADELFIHKGDIPTKDALLTIDDEHGSVFNSQAPNQWLPNDTRIEATMTAWGLKTASATAAPTGFAGGPK